MYPGTRNLQSFSNPCTRVHVFEKKIWQPKTATKSWKPLNLKGNVICATSVQKPEIFFFQIRVHSCHVQGVPPISKQL
jgi:hypothetical protein